MTAGFDVDRWAKIERLFYAALELKPADRPQFLSDQCNGDNELQEEVSSLLDASTRADEFMTKPLSGAVKAVAAQAQRGRLERGARINHYEVLSKIGSGGMGDVYLAMDTRLRRQIALKILVPDLTRDEAALRRFQQEAQATSALNHPNILTVFEFGEADGLRYIASEYVDGPTLRDRLLQGKLELNAAIGIATQIVSALAAAHALGILHRDIKPENIILRTDGLAKLVDFGIAKLSEVRTDTSLPETHVVRPLDQTQPGIVVGTVRYMSPEQAQAVVLDSRSDIFALGVVIYEMLAGIAPFGGESTREVITEILTMDPPALADFTPEVPPELEHIIGKALRKDREARYQTAKDLLIDLQLFQKNLEFEANLQRAGYADGGHRRSRPATAERRAATPAPPAFSEPQLVPASQAVAASSASSRRTAFLAWIFVLILVAIGATVLIKRHFDSMTTAAHPKAALRSLAVLPFRNINQDPRVDFLQFSLADSVITKLGYIKALTVRPSSSIEVYRNTDLDPQKIAAQLHVDMLLTGAYLKEGNRLRITTQLIDVKPDTILWRDTIDLTYDKLLTVQDRVAQQIIDGLSLKLSPAETEHIRSEKPANTAAYEYYLRGVDFYALNEFDEAIEMLQKSIALEPRYALAWAQLGRAYTTRASLEFGGREQYAKAKAAYEKALALDPGLADVRVYMANLLTDTGRAEQAVPLLKEALRTNPGNAEAHWELGYAYRFGGMLQESVAEAEEARHLDPEVKINSSAINSYLYLGEYQKFLESLPANNSVYMLFYHGFAEYYLRDFAQAETYFDRAYQMNPMLLPAPLGKALSYGLKHQKRLALELLHNTEATMNQRGVSDPEMLYKIAQAYAVLGDAPSALRVLRESIEGGFFCFPYFAKDPLLNNIRENAEFQKLMIQAQGRHQQFEQRFSPQRKAAGY